MTAERCDRCRKKTPHGTGNQVLDNDGEDKRYCNECYTAWMDGSPAQNTVQAVEGPDEGSTESPDEGNPVPDAQTKEVPVTTTTTKPKAVKKAAVKKPTIVPEATKECSRCNKRKPTGGAKRDGSFYRIATNPDGLSYYCKECAKKIQHDRRKSGKAPKGKSAKKPTRAAKAPKVKAAPKKKAPTTTTTTTPKAVKAPTPVFAPAEPLTT